MVCAGSGLDPTMSLDGKHILLGVSGGIAAYKTPELVRQLARTGAVVRVVMNRAAHEFVTATSLQAVSGERVRDDLWDPDAEAAMGHIELARWADLIVVAPATAHLVSRLAHGAADDLLGTLYLAAQCPTAIAPAMNQAMWRHPATQRNIATRANDGVHILGPDEGDQACGDSGPGRMREPEDIVTDINELLAAEHLGINEDVPGSLEGRRVLLTAGPTQEPIDPVRYVSNHSSGKQGFALAAAARAAGATVTLIAGPVSIAAPAGVTRVDVVTACDMQRAVEEHLPGTDIFISVAAVADYRPVEAHAKKLKKRQDKTNLNLELVENPDIIAAVAKRRAKEEPAMLVVGFAAETDTVIANARAKLNRKGLDMIVVNDVSDKRVGFESNANAVTVITAESEEQLPMASKDTISRQVVARVAALYQKRSAR
jgi:phosphopantothenoylcysteine decarboxylase/phosphopantothenate--cysteine ligase